MCTPVRNYDCYYSSLENLEVRFEGFGNQTSSWVGSGLKKGLEKGIEILSNKILFPSGPVIQYILFVDQVPWEILWRDISLYYTQRLLR